MLFVARCVFGVIFCFAEISHSVFYHFRVFCLAFMLKNCLYCSLPRFCNIYAGVGLAGETEPNFFRAVGVKSLCEEFGKDERATRGRKNGI